jgi:hypothetical protein
VLVLPIAPLDNLEWDSFTRKQRHQVVGRQSQRVLPPGDEAAQLSEAISPAKAGCCSYFQLTHSISAHSHEGRDLIVYQGPASQGGGERLLGFVRQNNQDALGQITFIDRIGFDISAEKSSKKRAWSSQIGLCFHVYAPFVLRAGRAIHFSVILILNFVAPIKPNNEKHDMG